jgi:drug/metabolite transporter (DMT)-like permease
VLVLAAATGFATKAIFVKLAYAYGVDPVTLLALRMLFALAFLVVFWTATALRRTPPDDDRPRAPLTRRDVAHLIVLGLLGYWASSLLDFLGLRYISASLERLILFLYPTFVVLLSAALLRRRIDRRSRWALLLSYVGIALVLSHDLRAAQPNVWLGGALVFASTLTYSLYLVGQGEVVRRLGPRRLSDAVIAVSSVAVLVQFALTRPLAALHLPAPVLAYGAAMGLVSTVLPIRWLAAGIERVGAGRAALVSSIGPVLTIALGVIVLGERLTTLQVVGALLVIGGVIVVGKPR